MVLNKALYEDVKAVLKTIEGLPYREARIVLVTAIEAIDNHCYLDLTTFKEEYLSNENSMWKK